MTHLWEDAEWTFPLIETTFKEIEKIAVEELGLGNVYRNEIEIISSEQMLDAYSSVGMPVMYQHWSFGKHFLKDKKMYDKGYQGLAYEIVINSDPCISYLMEENTMTMQALVMAHACVAGDTEYLSPTGWKRFDEYEGGLVGQYHENGKVTFTEPSEYIVREQKDFILIESEDINQAITDDHTVILADDSDDNNIIKMTGKEFVENTKPYWFIVGFNSSDFIYVQSDSVTTSRIESEDGKAYCFTVDTNMLLIRRDGKISVTGNCFGHNYFFKNNHLFKAWTDASAIIDYLAFAKNYISMCEEKHGVKEVEHFLDACHALQSYGVNKYKKPSKLSMIKERERQKEREETQRLSVNALYDRLIKKNDEKTADIFPREPEENLLYFCEKYSPDHPEWKREILRIVRKVAQYFSPQGQCVVGDTYIYTDNGMEMIQDVISEEGYNPFEINLLSIDNTFQKTSYSYKRKINKTIKITTSTGRIIEGTPEHPIEMLSNDLSFNMEKLENLKIGDNLVTKLSNNNSFAKKPLQFDFVLKERKNHVKCEICDKSYENLSTHIPTHGLTVEEYKSNHSNEIISEKLLFSRNKNMKIPKEMSPNLARLLGYFISEGSYTNYSWCISNTDKIIIDDVISIIKNEFGLEPTLILREEENKLPITTISLCNSSFREFMEYCGIISGKHSWDREIPWVILQSPKNIIKEFLSALFEGDGCNTIDGYIKYASTSYKLMHQLQIVLNNFSVASKIYKASDKTPHDTWVLSVIGDFYHDFLENIGFVTERKNQVNKDEIFTSSPYCKIPFVKKIINDLKEHIVNTHTEKEFKRNMMPYTSSTEFSRSKVKKLKSEFEYIKTINKDVYESINRVIDPNNFYDEIINIEILNDEKYVYDFTVPENHLFMTDNFVSHNTKTMNEGCATFVHYKIMNRLHEKGLMNDGSMIEFLKSHTSVVFQPEFDDPRYSGINPYALGFAMMMDIERICEKPTEEDYRWFPAIAGSGDGMAVLRDAWANYRDESFIRQFLSPKIIRDFKLFRIKDNSRDHEMKVVAIHDDTGYSEIRETLANQYESNNFVPRIEVSKMDPKTRTLNLTYTPYRGRVLNNPSIMLKHVKTIWGDYAINLWDTKDNCIAVG